VWTFVGIDADSKLIVSWLCGRRTQEYACDFMLDLESRLIARVQITSDGLNSYPFAVNDAFQNGVDYAQLIKIYGPDKSTPTRYSPPALTAIDTKIRQGNPDPAHISTSFVERSNLTIRMSMRRFTRLTNGFSKKYDNLKHAVALNFVYYNFCRIHKTLRVTPAMEAGLTDHVWGIEELVSLLD
jgi:IS1 family transposase